MPSSSSTADILRECRGYMTTLTATADQLPPHMQMEREELAEAVEQTEEAGIRQSHHRALMQQATRDQDEGKARCRAGATRVRNSLRGFYGPESEALSQYCIQPRRPPKKPKTDPPEVEVSPPQAEAPKAWETIQE